MLGHADVAPARRADPGELFDWRRLAAAGVGLWPEAARPRDDGAPTVRLGDRGPAVTANQRALAEFGYGVPVRGTYDEATAQVVTAFQRHFRPRLIDGAIDGETAGILRHIVAHA